MECLNRAIHMAEVADEYIKNGMESEEQAIAKYCLLPDKSFVGYRYDSKLYFLFEEYQGDIDGSCVWNMLQEFGVVSMDDLRNDYGNTDKQQWDIVVAHLKKLLNVPILKEKVLFILQEFGAITHGSNKNRHFSDYVNEVEMREDIIRKAKSIEGEKELASYFDDLVRSKGLNDIPSIGALKEVGIFVPDKWKTTAHRLRNKR